MDDYYDTTTERLIEIVRRQEMLYDPSHRDFLKVKLKDSIWTRIAATLNYTNGAEAKRTWAKLRNCHRDAIRRRRRGLSSTKVWRYQRQMDFLLPYMNSKNSENNGSYEKQYSGEDDVESDDKTLEIEEILIDDSPNETQTEVQLNFEDLCDTEISKNDDYNKRKEKQSKEQEASNDHLYHFFMSMYEITRNMPPRYQLNVRNHIYQYVSAAETELLDKQFQQDNSNDKPWYNT